MNRRQKWTFTPLTLLLPSNKPRWHVTASDGFQHLIFRTNNDDTEEVSIDFFSLSALGVLSSDYGFFISLHLQPGHAC